MINDVKQAITNKLMELFPPAEGYTVYDEDIPQNFDERSFMIHMHDQDYSKLIGNRFKSLLSFDIAYFTDSELDAQSDYHRVQMELLRINMFGSYRPLKKKANITDNVLHFTFNIRYAELKAEDYNPMQQHETHTNI